MKERPILMTPENAQKCFDGVKMQTRRIIKPQPPDGATVWQSEGIGDTWQVRRCDPWHSIKCPYGTAGDRLWIREAWQEKAWSLTELNRAGFLSAPKKPHETYLNQDLYAIHKGGYNTAIGDPGRWTPSLRMPRWACRTVVEITEIRVQRVQKISEEDAIEEGVCDTPFYDEAERYVSAGAPRAVEILAFAYLWQSINGPESWAQNPWVWAITFKKVIP